MAPRVSRTPPFPPTPLCAHLANPHRSFNLTTSTYYNSVNLRSNKTIFDIQYCQCPMEYIEQDIQDAIAKYHRGGCSMRSICKEFGIPRSTIRDRLSGSQ